MDKITVLNINEFPSYRVLINAVYVREIWISIEHNNFNCKLDLVNVSDGDKEAQNLEIVTKK